MKPWEQDYKDLCEVINFATDSNLKKDRLKKEILKTCKKLGYLNTRIFPPETQWGLCSARLRMGRFNDWTGWEYRSDFARTFTSRIGLQKLGIPYWYGQPVKHLVILGEQGIGDEILYGSVIPEVIVRLGHDPIEFHCHPRLHGLFERSFRIRCTPRKTLSEVKEGDAVVMLADLMRFFRKDKSHFPRKPFLKPIPEKVEEFRERLRELGPKKKVGVAHKARHGTVNPKKFMVDDYDYINLQYGEITEGSIDFGLNPLEELESQFALIKALDEVICVTQSVVHIAGAVGTPCQAIVPDKKTAEKDVAGQLWYYGNRDHYIYGNVTVHQSINEFIYQRNSERAREAKGLCHRPESGVSRNGGHAGSVCSNDRRVAV